MSQIHPAQLLLDDHRAIESVLDVFAVQLSRLGTRPFPAPWFAEALEFFRYFVEGCHHNREETIVFPDLLESGLLAQHTAGTSYVERLEDAFDGAVLGEPEALDTFRRAGLHYVNFLRQHIREEDEVLRWAARRPVSEEEVARLQRGAEQFHGMDEETHAAYLALAEKLAAARAA